MFVFGIGLVSVQASITILFSVTNVLMNSYEYLSRLCT